MDLEANGIRIHYTIEGDGPPVVLLHGFPLDRSMWDPQVRALSRDYRVIAPDLRGLGATQLGNVDTSSMEFMADDVHALLERIGVRQPVVLGGLSMGGYVAFAFWRQRHEQVRGLFLADTRATADTDEARRNRFQLIEQMERDNSIRPAVEAMFPKLMAPASYDRAELVAHVQGMNARQTPAGLSAALRGIAARPDSTPLLGQIECPTLIVVGQQDSFTPPSDARAMHAAIPSSELLEVPNAGHLAPLEAPDAVNQVLLGFLDRNLRG
jgi:3-oxoadipate enol-lactonase